METKGQIHVARAQRNVTDLGYTAANFLSKCPIHKALTWKFAAVYPKSVRRKAGQFKWGGYHLNQALSRAGRTAHAPDANFPTCFARNYDAPTFCESRREKRVTPGKFKNLKIIQKRRGKDGHTLTWWSALSLRRKSNTRDDETTGKIFVDRRNS